MAELQLLRSLFDGELPAAVFFDLDGTLVDSVPDLAQAVDAMLVSMGFAAAGESKVRGWVGNGAFKLVERAMVDAQGRMPTDESLSRAHQVFLKCYSAGGHDQSRLYAGVTACLEVLRAHQIPLAIITNKPGQFTPRVLEKLKIDEYFDLVLSGDTFTQKKPDPLPLVRAAEMLSVILSDCLMVGDSRNDIDAAKNAGIRSTCVTYGYNYGEPVSELAADATVDSLAELL
ncbi:Phosphoglycolate phosphatase [BD1-7 clade bacterium]|uniref:Phosphoglycolate phosphatase n=1 Tax=BD1-7 clade bacterium TaxID=2029982 RepID=A0A5S9QY24_9GAMM|nr:Phosphoglycolate phosphatase [BD1-7 clade bacterium]